MYERISLLDDYGNKFQDELSITMLNTFSGIMRTNHNPTAPPLPRLCLRMPKGNLPDGLGYVTARQVRI
jgi:hypothetical protein